MASPLIGVIGGAGPYAGLDLVRKIFDQTQAQTDQAHLPVALLSLPAEIPDRTAFLTTAAAPNPAPGIQHVAEQLVALAARVMGLPCVTAHAPRIFAPVQAHMVQHHPEVKLLHIVEETIRFIRTHFPQIQTVGAMSTNGTLRARLFVDALENAGFTVAYQDEDVQETIIHRAIYDPEYGLKAQSQPVSARARQDLVQAVDHLQEKGAEAIILGCTELPLALPEATLNDLPLIDPTLALARGLIRETAPEKLRPFP